MRMEKQTKVFRDPVHGLITFDISKERDAVILDLIGSPEFQRLRRIRQLGVAWVAYHGAEHSRFSHSMGVCHLAGLYLDRLYELYGTEIFAGEDDYLENRRLVRCAALLHDIGHGPFSHVLETAIKKINPMYKMSHEEWTKRIITNENTSVNKYLIRHKVDPYEVCNIINQTHENPILVNIVTSQFDADRMDYLQRDSLFTGVKYGLVDQEWLIHSLRQGLTKNKERVIAVSSSKGKNSIVNFILARKDLFQQVYFHHKIRSAEQQLLNIFKGIGSQVKQKKDFLNSDSLVRFFANPTEHLEVEDYIKLDDFLFISAIDEVSNIDIDKTLQLLCKKFMRTEIFKNELIKISDKSFYLASDLKNIFSGFAEGYDYEYFFGIDEARKTYYENNYTRGEKPEERREEEKEIRNEIWVMNEDDILDEISTASEEIRAIMHSPENKTGNFSLCFDQEFYKRDKVARLIS